MSENTKILSFELEDGGQSSNDDHSIAMNNPALNIKIMESNKSNRWKYTCSGCGANVWGKPNLKLSCDECQKQFSSQEVAEIL